MKWLALILWALLLVAASFVLPAYKGDIGDSNGGFIVEVILIAVLAAIAPIDTAKSVRTALLHALPGLALLAAAALIGIALNQANSEDRGEPIFLYFGIALWGSWAFLLVLSAVLARAKWTSLAGLGVTFLVACLGLLTFSVRVD